MNDFQALCAALLESEVARKQTEHALMLAQQALTEAQRELDTLKAPPETPPKEDA